ncbi:MAG: Piwi domain-containing protein [Podila humilis]|nr:MAG: Piwi domain-containing protein [Podila humilis]
MTRVPARVLPEPKLLFHVTSHQNHEIPRNGIWNMSQKRELIACVIPKEHTTLIKKIHKAADTDIGISTQCMTIEDIKAERHGYFIKTCLEMNAKLGGINIKLDTAELHPGSGYGGAEYPAMVIEISTSNTSASNHARWTIASATASIDKWGSRFVAATRNQDAGAKTVTDLKSMIKVLLKAYEHSRGRLPKCIVVYRDGISEDMFPDMGRFEIPDHKTACSSMGDKYQPTITFVATRSDHHTRIFPIAKGSSHPTGNCLPGTVVSSQIVHPIDFDFYFQNEAGKLEATSVPMHYHVLQCDRSFRNQRAMHLMTFNMCHLDARWAHTGSLVPAVANARLAVKRASSHVNPPSTTWGDRTSEKFVKLYGGFYLHETKRWTKEGPKYGTNTNNE